MIFESLLGSWYLDCKKFEPNRKYFASQTSAFVKPISTLRPKKRNSSEEEKYETKFVGNSLSFEVTVTFFFYFDKIFKIREVVGAKKT